MSVLLLAKELYDIRNNAKKKANGKKIRMIFRLVCFIRSPTITDNETVNIKQKFLTQTLVKVNGVKSERIETQINSVSAILKALSVFTSKYLVINLIAHNRMTIRVQYTASPHQSQHGN